MKVHQLRPSPALAVCAALCLFTLVPPPPAAAQSEVIRDRLTVPFDVVRENPCLGADGEEVLVTGELDVRVQTVVDAAGGVHSTFNLVPHVTAVGAESGIEYRILGGQRSHFNASAQNGSLNITDEFGFNVIGRGPGDNSLVRGVFHVTVNAQGVETVVVDNFTSRCVG